jgi:hypothetical protein
LGDARMLAVRTAEASPSDYGRNFRGIAMVFEVVESGENAGYYIVDDQQHTRGNLALKISCDEGYPVRVSMGARATMVTQHRIPL